MIAGKLVVVTVIAVIIVFVINVFVIIVFAMIIVVIVNTIIPIIRMIIITAVIHCNADRLGPNRWVIHHVVFYAIKVCFHMIKPADDSHFN